MTEGDPAYDELVSQEFLVSLSAGDQLGDKRLMVGIVDKVLGKTVQYEAI